MDDLQARLERLIDHRPYVFRDTPQDVAEAYIRTQRTFVGLREEEVVALERSLGVTFPRGDEYQARFDRLAAAGTDDELHEVGGDRRGLSTEEVLDDALAAGDRHGLVGEHRAQVVVRLERPGEAEQLVLDLADRALDARDLEEGVGVPVDPGVTVRHRYLAPTELM